MSKDGLGDSIVHHQDRTVSALFHLCFTDSIPGYPTIRLGPSNHPQALCGPHLGVSRLDDALGHKTHTMTENLHALSAHGPQFPGTLDLTGLFRRRGSRSFVTSRQIRPFEVLESPNGPNFFFQRSYGWSRLTQPGTQPFEGANRRLKSVDGISPGSHVRKTPFSHAAVCVLEPL